MKTAVTHNGVFHSDDVAAWALICEFFPDQYQLVRTRDESVIERADLVFDVGGVYDPSNLRFDHHQQEYEGNRASCGMIMDFIQHKELAPEGLVNRLRSQVIAYIDKIDLGLTRSSNGVPCLDTVISSYYRLCQSDEEYDEAFVEAAKVIRKMIEATRYLYKEQCITMPAIVQEAMEEAERTGSRLLWLGEYGSFKNSYFKNGGAEHCTEFMGYAKDGKYMAVGIPRGKSTRKRKRLFPQAWAGLKDEALEKVCGIEGARFCHQQRHMIVFDTFEGLRQAIEGLG